MHSLCGSGIDTLYGRKNILAKVNTAKTEEVMKMITQKKS
jgi:hypothetical protein